jgi:hypothetical protein
MAVTLWKAEYHHLAFLDPLMGSQSSIAFSSAVLPSCDFFSAISCVIISCLAVDAHQIIINWTKS